MFHGDIIAPIFVFRITNKGLTDGTVPVQNIIWLFIILNRRTRPCRSAMELMMEGSLLRTFPRTEQDTPVEVRDGDNLERVSRGLGNLSAGGLFVRVAELPVGAPVSVKVFGDHPFEAEGVVRHVKPQTGVGIQFTNFTLAERRMLDEHIADLTLRGLPAA